MFNTACPGLFGTPAEFRKNFEVCLFCIGFYRVY